MLRQALNVFAVRPDFDLQLMSPNQSLAELTAQLLQALPAVLTQAKPDLTVVQGDTATTFCGALSSFYAGVEVAHVEAGLRTGRPRAPFPEEMNRLLTSRLATLHFPATESAANNLRREGIPDEAIEVTGNTGIDAVMAARQRLEAGTSSGLPLALLDTAKRLIVVTAHRRESFGSELENICHAVLKLAERGDVQIVWPVHRNPNVREPVESLLRGQRNILLLAPLDYLPFVDLMLRSYLLLTDSGGIQEEGPSLGKPVLVLRKVTERPEAVEAGTVRMVGTEVDAIVTACGRLLDRAEEYRSMARLHNPYGDGHACERVARRISAHLGAALP